MTSPRIAVVFYSTYGTNHQIATEAAEAARNAGAEVRLRQVPETAPRDVVEGQEAWKAQREKMADIPEVTHDDMDWADAYFFSAPTRYGTVASQMRAFIDTLGGLWSEGRLADKPATVTTSAANTHGGQESTLLGMLVTFAHWGAIPLPPGYTDGSIYEAGGNPYGYSATAGAFDEAGRKAVRHQAQRLADVTAQLKVGRSEMKKAA